MDMRTDSVAQTVSEAGLCGMEEGRYKTEDHPPAANLLASVLQIQWSSILLKN